jgi:hypothetical protein
MKDSKQLIRARERAVEWKDLRLRDFRKGDSPVVIRTASFQPVVDGYAQIMGFNLRQKKVKLGDDAQFGSVRLPHSRDQSTPLWLFDTPRMLKERELQSYQMYTRGRSIGRYAWDQDMTTFNLAVNGTCMMSIVPLECLTQRRAIGMARGRVVIGGMGLGWLALEVLSRPQVQHVTVVEKREKILDYFGQRLSRHFGSRLTLVGGDAFSYLDKMKTAPDVVLMDIWAKGGDALWDGRWLKRRESLQEKGIKTWEWA